MVDTLKPEVRKFPDLAALSEAAAADITRLITETVSRKGHFSVALSGGSTPKPLHNILGTVYREKIPWESVSVFFGDERYVPHTDKQSNYLMARETLLNFVSIPVQNIHPIPTDLADPKKAAEAYEKELRKVFQDGRTAFDLLLLGMGGEGHTASLFPDSPALDEKKRWVTAVDVPAQPSKRITLTYPFLNRSSVIYFLVSGGDKSTALKEVLSSKSDYHTFPAKGMRPLSGKLVWWLDREAMVGWPFEGATFQDKLGNPHFARLNSGSDLEMTGIDLARNVVDY